MRTMQIATSWEVVSTQRYDVAVVGSGPAGLEAAVNLKIRKKNFLLFGSPLLSRKVETAPRIDNYLGLHGISGKDLQEKFKQHLEMMEIEILQEQVQMVYPMGDYFALASSTATYEASTVILAPGAFSDRLLEGETQFLGRGVGYCATCDAPLYKGKTVAVLGYSEEAVYETNYIADLAAKTYYLPAKRTAIMPREGVEILEGSPTGITGDTAVRALMVDGRAVAVDGIFILRDSVAPASLLPGVAVKDGFIAVDAGMATNISGCYAAGDCTGKPHQYMRAAGQGQTAALNVAAYLDIRNSKKKE